MLGAHPLSAKVSIRKRIVMSVDGVDYEIDTTSLMSSDDTDFLLHNTLRVASVTSVPDVVFEKTWVQSVPRHFT